MIVAGWYICHLFFICFLHIQDRDQDQDREQDRDAVLLLVKAISIGHDTMYLNFLGVMILLRRLKTGQITWLQIASLSMEGAMAMVKIFMPTQPRLIGVQLLMPGTMRSATISEFPICIKAKDLRCDGYLMEMYVLSCLPDIRMGHAA